MKKVDIFFPDEITILAKKRPLLVEGLNKREKRTAIRSEISNDKEIWDKKKYTYCEVDNEIFIYTYEKTHMRDIYPIRKYFIPVFSICRTIIGDEKYTFFANNKKGVFMLFSSQSLIEYISGIKTDQDMVYIISENIKKLYLNGQNNKDYIVYSDKEFDTVETRYFAVEELDTITGLQKSEILRTENKLYTALFGQKHSVGEDGELVPVVKKGIFGIFPALNATATVALIALVVYQQNQNQALQQKTQEAIAAISAQNEQFSKTIKDTQKTIKNDVNKIHSTIEKELKAITEQQQKNTNTISIIESTISSMQERNNALVQLSKEAIERKPNNMENSTPLALPSLAQQESITISPKLKSIGNNFILLEIEGKQHYLFQGQNITVKEHKMEYDKENETVYITRGKERQSFTLDQLRFGA
jgi:hypothetical protein